MDRASSKTRLFLIAAFAVSLAGSLCTGVYGQGKGKVIKAKAQPADAKTADGESVEPDKVLYLRATASMKRGRYTESRLDFQTLINTYPDSEYLAKAKLGIADSFYKEGGTSNLTQAVSEYKNFIVFFPFLDEAQYAQMQVAMAHYRMMEKADRDTTQAEEAEDEFREFILKYPRSPLLPQAEQNMRNVQEVLADGEFRIAHFYYARPDDHAAAARLLDVTQRYPLYSQSDQALWMLGEIYVRTKQASKNEDVRNHWSDLAGQCFRRIVQEYPLSPLAPAAKERLKSMGMPVPAPDPDAVARMRQQQLYVKEHHQVAALKIPLGMIQNSPDVYAAARSGQPNLNPPDDTVSPTDVLQGPAEPGFTVAATTSSSTGSDTRAAVDTESIETGGATDSSSGAAPAATSSDTTPAATSAAAPANDAAPAATAAIQMIDAPGNATVENSAAAAPAPALGPAAPANSAPPGSAGPTAFSDAAPTGGMPGSTSSGTQTSSAQAATGQTAAPADSKTESTSKKKKGLKKLVPF